MPNGDSILGGPSATQAALILPKPGCDSLFYVFTCDHYQSSGPPNHNAGYRYSVVNMCLSNGYGEVLPDEKNILLATNSTEKLCAVRDNLGTGYWILGHRMFSHEYIAWHLTSAGIIFTTVSNDGTAHGWPNAGEGLWQMKFNHQGTKVAAAIGNRDPGIVSLMDFDNVTGIVSNECRLVIDSAIGGRSTGVEFSPDGSKLYVGGGNSIGGFLYQYNMNAGGGNCAAIRNSKTSVTASSIPGFGGYLQLAPNSKIYCGPLAYYTLACISAPNSIVANCGFIQTALTFTNYMYSLPSALAGYSYSNNLVTYTVAITGIHEDKEIEQDFFIAPNPNTGLFTLKCKQTIDEVQIINQYSEIILNSKPHQKELQCELQAGIYFAKIKSGSQMYVRKIVVR